MAIPVAVVLVPLPGPADDPDNHRIINLVEVALAPFVRIQEATR